MASEELLRRVSCAFEVDDDAELTQSFQLLDQDGDGLVNACDIRAAAGRGSVKDELEALLLECESLQQGIPFETYKVVMTQRNPSPSNAGDEDMLSMFKPFDKGACGCEKCWYLPTSQAHLLEHAYDCSCVPGQQFCAGDGTVAEEEVEQVLRSLTSSLSADEIGALMELGRSTPGVLISDQGKQAGSLVGTHRMNYAMFVNALFGR